LVIFFHDLGSWG